MTVLINNLQQDSEIDRETLNLIEQVINQVLTTEVKEDKEVSVAIVNDQYIKELNNKFRDKNETTDVLSFPQNDEQLLGDIIISLETATRQAIEYNHSVAREVGFLTVHSMLHLLGYNHKQKAEKIIMRQKEEEILTQLGLTREE
ncbi:metalloprotein, YbeY/UPF0054 family [Halobacteroides halobius DSM 5150]|uniref:Endoribonuclease YbeY n=1 Tax=Halobacteroides halobius (strain ATCC 35273 / DSM 5150 / MD-1) TaxID=748449 RepID=L0K956_HALHC|nr:rRNA maturation RNase YbeY [Halobacteroides halobius]AGB41797.1 metalloprotein, YbeY/UPF0054 family [Halobacteroides halobius DSM 5150]